MFFTSFSTFVSTENGNYIQLPTKSKALKKQYREVDENVDVIVAFNNEGVAEIVFYLEPSLYDLTTLDDLWSFIDTTVEGFSLQFAFGKFDLTNKRLKNVVEFDIEEHKPYPQVKTVAIDKVETGDTVLNSFETVWDGYPVKETDTENQTVQSTVTYRGFENPSRLSRSEILKRQEMFDSWL
jgi:hypothetical protein